MIKFEWDEAKNKANRKKHGVWFEEAAQVFSDPKALQFFDKEHSQDEDRFILVGSSGWDRVLVVIHCEKFGANNISIISARKATKKERMVYEKGI